jgi:two-component system phosphate regulon response regulator PhoB
MKTILIADDEENIRILIETTLASPGCRLIQCSTGAEAVALAKTERPDLVILDWMMPLMSGLDVLRSLRADQGTSGIPVIMLTAMGNEKSRSRGMDAGARAYLSKPFSPLELLQIVQHVLAPAQTATGT